MPNGQDSFVSTDSAVETAAVQLPDLATLAKKDSDLKEMIKLICQYNLRSQAVYLIQRKIIQAEPKKRTYAR